MPKITHEDLWVLSQVIYGEARGEPIEGQRAVAWVVLNRERLHPRWRGKSLSTIARAPWQFSCFNKNDPNREKLNTVGLEDMTFAQCVQVALDVLTGRVPDPTHGATHYYAEHLAARDASPPWAHGQTPSAHIGHHLFFAEIA